MHDQDDQWVLRKVPGEEAVSLLPKWIHDAFGRSFECSDGEKLEEALSIAWEALEEYEIDLTSNGKRATKALRRITELSDEK